MKPLLIGALATAGLIAACAPTDHGVPNTGEAHRYDRIRLGPGDLADAATTTYGLIEMGAREANPILAPFGDAAGLVALPLKYGAKHLLVAGGSTPASANVTIESLGLGAACSNIMVMTGALIPQALGVGAACLLASRALMKNEYEKSTGKTLAGKPAHKR